MNEFISRHHEHREAHEHIDIAHEVEKNLREIESLHKKHESEQAGGAVEKIRETIEAESTQTESVLPNLEQDQEQETFLHSMHGNLKEKAYEKTLEEIRDDLAPHERFASKLFHRPVVEATSEILSKTVARPVSSSIGAIIVSIGLSASLYLSYRYGFEFNYLLFLLLFIGGYGLGVIVELLLRPFKKEQI